MRMPAISRALLGRAAAAAVAVPLALPTPGGWAAVAPDAQPVRAAAASAAGYLGRQLGRTFVIERLGGTESRTVDGVEYRLTLRLAQVEDDFLGPARTCTVTVRTRPWLESAQVTGFACSDIATDAPAGLAMLPL